MDPATGTLDCTTTYDQRLQQLKLYSLQRRRERYLILYLAQIASGLVPNPGDRITWSYNQRTKLRLACKAPAPSTPAWVRRLRHNSIFGVGITIYNLLPRHLREFLSSTSSHPTTAYKRQLDKYLQTVPDTPGASTVSTHNSLVHQLSSSS